MIADIVLLPGDGIGPEVIASATRVLQAIARMHGHDFRFTTALVGGAAIDQCGTPLPPETLRVCKSAHAVLLGAVGGPAWSGRAPGPEAGLLELRQELGVFANLRPVRVAPGLEHWSPLRPELASGIDLLLIRELTGGVYFGKPRGRRDGRAIDTMAYTVDEITRVAHVAFEQAVLRRGRVTSIDKANVLESSRLWRETVTQVARGYPDVELDHMLVDAAAMALVLRPRHFDVILTGNLFGDILSDEAAALAGGLGLAPSAAIGLTGPGLFEPVHGSAPDIAGKGIANPVGAMLSAAMMCELALGLREEARTIAQAVEDTLRQGACTADLGGRGGMSTHAFTDLVLEMLSGR